MMRLPRSVQSGEPESSSDSWLADPLTLSRVLAFLGAALVIGSLAFAAPGARVGTALLGFTIWGLAPYMVLLLMGRLVPSPWVVGGAGLLAVTIEASVRASVFVFPQRSTAAVALLVLPAWVGAGLLVGSLAGFVVGRLWGTGRAAARAVGMVLVLGGLGFVALGLARPDLLPTAVLRRRALLERIGPPRVVSGENAFEQKVISTDVAWFQAADLDGLPGDEVAAVKPGSGEIFDGVTFEKRNALTLGGEPRLWNGFSRLARLDGNTVIVQTGGGFSPTEVRALDGSVLWSYRPAGPSQPPPTSMRPADLDGDGALEFYASTNTGIVRLDGQGREVWSHKAAVDQIVAVVPRSGSEPGLVVAAGDGRAILVSDSGSLIGEIKAPAETVPLALFDTPGGRGIAFGGASFAVYAPDGRKLFDRAGEEGLRVVAAVSVRPGPGADPFYAIVSQAPRDVARARLLLVDAKGADLQNVVLAKAPGVFKGTAADGSETLFVVGSRFTALKLRAR